MWSPCSPRSSQEFSPAPQLESINSSALSLLYGPLLILYMATGKTVALTIRTFLGKVRSLLFNMLSRFVVAFLPRSKHLLISWLQSLSTVILESKNIKSVIVSTFAPSICHEVIWLSRPTTGHMPQENYYLKRQCMTYPSVYCRSLFLNVIPINKSFLSQSLFLITI